MSNFNTTQSFKNAIKNKQELFKSAKKVENICKPAKKRVTAPPSINAGYGHEPRMLTYLSRPTFRSLRAKKERSSAFPIVVINTRLLMNHLSVSALGDGNPPLCWEAPCHSVAKMQDCCGILADCVVILKNFDLQPSFGNGEIAQILRRPRARKKMVPAAGKSCFPLT
jgi:hypothetical protein